MKEPQVVGVYKHRTLQVVLNAAVLASVALLVGGFAFVSRDFGHGIPVVVLSLVLALPLAFAVRLRLRWPAVRGREFVFFAVLFCVAAGTSWFAVQAWYTAGLDRYHAEDMKWAKFDRRLRRDPAFREVEIEKSVRKN
ncbi:MAG: hypothetical protein ACRDD1_00375, partial [Planctomycetia bacterium]